MKLSQLKNRDVVVFRNMSNDSYISIDNLFICGTGFMQKDSYNEDLTCKGISSKNFDVVKVYRPKYNGYLTLGANNEFIDKFTLIYEREEDIKVGDYVVNFKENGIKVGCTTVDKETVEKIYKKLFPEYKINYTS